MARVVVRAADRRASRISRTARLLMVPVLVVALVSAAAPAAATGLPADGRQATSLSMPGPVTDPAGDPPVDPGGEPADPPPPV
ncbi:hypothetical protein GSF22_23225, partial [Micromonospora echinofusca]|nr:hypothetical protein [Micromonospora echinofusca]